MPRPRRKPQTQAPRKMVPIPPALFESLQAYRASLTRDVPEGAHVPLHAALAHALHIASSIRNIQGDTQ